MSKWLRVVSIFLPFGLIVLGLSALVIWSREPTRFPVRTIEIREPLRLKQISEAEIRAAVVPLLVKGFFWLDVRSAQKELQQIPWLRTADVRRVWPDKLVISVEEQTAQAKWGDKGILSTEGVIFYPKLATVSEKLPQFNGPDDRAREMLQQYFTLLETLGPIGLTVCSIDLSSTGNWRVVLDNGIEVVLGKTGLPERLNRFRLAYQSNLQAKSEHIAYVDLRYSNGFAIGWKVHATK